jgi:hypothetical protein
MLSPAPKGIRRRDFAELRSLVGDRPPEHEGAHMMQSYMTAAAPKGGHTYSAQNLGLT